MTEEELKAIETRAPATNLLRHMLRNVAGQTGDYPRELTVTALTFGELVEEARSISLSTIPAMPESLTFHGPLGETIIRPEPSND